METSNSSTGPEWSDLPLFAGDTPVSLSQQQVIAKVKKILATCGLGYDKPLASYNPTTQSWKMSEGIFPSGEQPSLPILPPSGMTRNGELFQQPPWEPIIGATASSSWPTPTTMDFLPARSEQALQRQMDKNRPGRKGAPTLKDAVAYPAMWPTPRSSSAMNEDIENLATRLRNGMPYKTRLEEAVAIGPTPTASDAWTDGLKSSQQKEGSRHSVNLPSAAGGKLNPMWVEWLMGFPPGWTDLED